MAAQGERRGRGLPTAAGEHRWVGAAVVALGNGPGSVRAEHAARTGRHVLPARTRVDVLEVYCSRCRVGYTSHAASRPCTGVATAAG
jgi:hypothetical protein